MHLLKFHKAVNGTNRRKKIKAKLVVSEIIAFCICRGLFIIDGRGILRQITMNDLPVGRSTDETLRLLQAFQYTDKHGEGKFLFHIEEL